MKVSAEPVRAADLRTGDLFSEYGPEYWWIFPNFLGVGHAVFLRTATETPEGEENLIVYRLRIVPDEEEEKNETD